ncbi:MAG: HU family DNA-binding protein [Prevotella sp.]|nr:HU family DNA-binding protein [Candidatus Prevotella equi]
MTNKELEQQIAKATGREIRDVKEIMDAFVSLVTHHVKNDDKVSVGGLGIFSKVETKEKMLTNGFCKNKVIPARRKVKFTASKQMKDTLQA